MTPYFAYKIHYLAILLLTVYCDQYYVISLLNEYRSYAGKFISDLMHLFIYQAYSYMFGPLYFYVAIFMEYMLRKCHIS